MNELNRIIIRNYTTQSGTLFPEIELSYEVFGSEDRLRTHGILVTHALTGNSNVAGNGGWWANFVGYQKGIDLNHYAVIAFNIPGNGYGLNPQLFDNYRQLSTRDIAHLFYQGLQQLQIERLYAIVGGSLGGVLAWELAIEYPNLAELIVPIGADYKITDWILAHNKVQEQILENSSNPLHDARMMAMMFYRTPQSCK